MNFSLRLDVPQLSQTKLPVSIPSKKSNVSSRSSSSVNMCLSSRTTRMDSPDPSAVHEASKNSDCQPLIDFLHHCADVKSGKLTKAAHSLVLKFYFYEQDSLILLNHTAYSYFKCSEWDLSRRVFENMSTRNAFSWTVMILASVHNHLLIDGLDYFIQMMSQRIFPDKFAYTAAIRLCMELDSVELGEMVHAQVVVTGFISNSFVATSLLNMYAKLGKMEKSCKIFGSMTERNVVAWNAFLSGLTSSDRSFEAYDYFVRMKQEGVTLDVFTLINASKAVGKLGDIWRGKEVHRDVLELDIESNVPVGTALIDMYGKCGSISEARFVFEKHFRQLEINAPWNAMIAAHVQGGQYLEALELFVEMCFQNVECDLYTYCSVFNALASVKWLRLTRAVHNKLLKFGCYMMLTSVNNALADAYAKCDCLEDVKKVFEAVPERDLVSWTTMLAAYIQCSEEEKALTLFSEMREEGLLPNQYTYSSMLVACAKLCFLEYGQQLHGILIKTDNATDRCTESALLDMYAKSGILHDARKVFDKILDPDVVSWTAIIMAYAQHGFALDALELFQRMEIAGTAPNSVTFLSVLFACSHAGLVEEGLKYFNLVKDKYGLVPEMEHYACMVDLLGRFGGLDEAMDFIMKMPVAPNEMIWQSLLGACGVHKNTELGKMAMEKILSISAGYSAPYVLLSNAYLQTGNLQDGIGLREVMKELGVRKEPGNSWIYIDGVLNKFFAGDQQHPQKDDIYSTLEDLTMKMKQMGHVSVLGFPVDLKWRE